MAGEKVGEPLGGTVIGVIDSGLGGLSVLKEIHALLPGNSVLYFGDSQWCPYGSKSPEVIQRRVLTVTDYLLSKGVGLLVVGCNSATIHAIELLRSTYPIPIVGMEPAVKPAAETSKTGVVAVLATEASIAGEKFHQLADFHARQKGVRLITQPCPEFVELVERGILDGPEVELAVSNIITPLLDGGADVFVLGCTHYLFLKPVIESVLPEGTKLIETGNAVARRVQAVLPRAGTTRNAEVFIETSGSMDIYRTLAPRLLPGIGFEMRASEL